MAAGVFGGPFRYYAARFHFPWLPYLPHLILALVIVPMFFLYVTSEGVTSTYLVILVLFGVGAAYGLVNLNSARQVVFGLWVLVAFLYGVLALPAIVRGWRKLTPYVLLLWAFAVVGVLVNAFYQWPWVGFEYQVGSTSIVASRLWVIPGASLARLPGFSVGSYFTAVQILFLAIFLRETLRKRWRIPMWILSGTAIALTTSKAAIGIFLLLSIMWLFYHGAIRPSWRLIPIGLAVFDILLPFSMLAAGADWLDSTRSPIASMLLSSLADRMHNGWPDWIRMIVAHGSTFLGRGLGGIGAAQQYFEPALYSPADNIAVFLYGTFGVLGLALLVIYGWKATHWHPRGSVEHFLFFCVCVVLFEGITADVLGSPFIALAFGASLRYIQERPYVVLRTTGTGCQGKGQVWFRRWPPINAPVSYAQRRPDGAE